MRRLWILTVTLCLLPVFGMQAQEYTQTPVTISKEKVRGSDGNVYYSHVVLDKQTLFSISKAYGVTIEEIYDANPAANLRTEGLKKNAIILIPVQSSAPQAVATPAAAAPQMDKDGFISHTVRWYEDINDIAAKYGVSVELIMQANDLTSKKLKNRQKIRIPKDPVAFLAKIHANAAQTEEPLAEVPAEPETPVVESEQQQQEEVQPEEQSRRWRFPSIFGNTSSRKSSVSTVLLLPMKNGTSMDFYSGFLMAVKEMGEKGIGSELNVYDVSGGALPVTASRLEDADVVIGPIAPTDLTKVLNLADGHAAIVSPLDQKAASLVVEHRNLVQAPASLAAQFSDVIRWVREDRQAGDKVVVISERNGVQSEFYGMIEASNLEFIPFSYSILQGRGITSSLGGTLTRDGVNRIILDSESEAFVTDVVRNLSLLIHNRYPIVVYSPSKVRSFDTIDVEYLHNVNLHVSMSYFIDYDSPKVRDFLLAYRGLYGTEPNQFAFQGYDLASYFIQPIAELGDSWIDKLDRISRKEGLQADFQFVEAGHGGLVNHSIRRAVYNPDFSIKIVR